MPELKKIRETAMSFVENYESSHGRKKWKDVSSTKGIGYDIESNGRKIEVKGTTKTWKMLRSQNVGITWTETHYSTHIYLVCDVLVKPDLHIIPMEKIPFKAIKVTYDLNMPIARDYEEIE